MPEPEPNRSEQDGGEEVGGEFVVSGGDAAEMLEFVEEALDKVALPINLAVDDAADPDVALGGDVGGGAAGFDGFDDRASEEAAVGDDIAGQGEAVDKAWKGGLVGGLTRRQDETDRQAVGIDHGVDFSTQSSTRTTDGVIRAPFFPPAACWWARTIEVSIR